MLNYQRVKMNQAKKIYVWLTNYSIWFGFNQGHHFFVRYDKVNNLERQQTIVGHVVEMLNPWPPRCPANAKIHWGLNETWGTSGAGGVPSLVGCVWTWQCWGCLHWNIHNINQYDKWYTIWLFNIAMENCSFIDDLPIKNGDFPWLC